jgi:phosphoglycolate phosphatase
MAMKKMVIFDFDGTISNSMHLAYQIYEELSRKYGFKQFTHEEINELKTLSIHERLKKHHISIFKLPRLARKTRKIIQNLMADVYPFEGMKQLMDELKNHGYFIGIVSSNSEKNIQNFLEHHQFCKMDIILGKASFFGKERLLKKIQRKFKNTAMLYVGDEVRDIISCKNVGIRVASVTWGFDDIELLSGAEPDYLVTDMDTLKKVLLEV